ncbi:hypothetical protein BJ912DRAFT_634280 [Pholiota molesta]|nr:hypothetical protein BJ912DRAFT_634280 [Pholiota molesta]
MDDLEGNELQEGEDEFSDDEEKVRILLEAPSSESGSDESGGNDTKQLAALQELQPTFEEKLLRTLRDHVFNTMPIRLLSFEPHEESTFIITLIERDVIYARIASALQRKMQEEEFRPQKAWISGTETDEEIIERLISKYARYAILSHTWLRTASGELTYGDWNNGIIDANDPGYQKLVNFCKAAWKDYELTFGWMDTICINKESSSEHDESIRSMYKWYRRAAICITYLAETGTLTNMHLDPWFTRGWTLQELLAPRVIKFYNRHWERFVDFSDNDKAEAGIRKQIERATSISRSELYAIHGASISRRMQLAASREVTREEDTAYSLMGLFNVSISTAYGEGADRAFSRLLQEILLSSHRVLDILNWGGDLPSSRSYTSRILPSSPRHYVNRSSNHNLDLGAPAEPLTLTHLGLRVPVILMPGIWNRIGTSRHDSVGDYNAIDCWCRWLEKFYPLSTDICGFQFRYRSKLYIHSKNLHCIRSTVQRGGGRHVECETDRYYSNERAYCVRAQQEDPSDRWKPR